MTIWFDMDGTFVDLYGVNNWLPKLLAGDPSPYENALPLIDIKQFEKILATIQRNGAKIGVISWGAKNPSSDYLSAVDTAKRNWLKTHLPTTKWDEICILPYGTPKNLVAGADDILIDDEEQNRKQWKGQSFPPSKIFHLAQIC